MYVFKKKELVIYHLSSYLDVVPAPPVKQDEEDEREKESYLQWLIDTLSYVVTSTLGLYCTVKQKLNTSVFMMMMMRNPVMID